jgi:hypothetical protein
LLLNINYIDSSSILATQVMMLLKFDPKVCCLKKKFEAKRTQIICLMFHKYALSISQFVSPETP